MFLHFFYELRTAKLPVSLQEYFALMDALQVELMEFSIDNFYYLSRAALVKDERHLDKFDRIFAQVFKGVEIDVDELAPEISEAWLTRLSERFLTEEEKAQIKALGGWRQILDEFKNRLREQKRRHQGGSKWIGTAGTSPFGAFGYNPEGIRIGQSENRNNRAIKVWDKRQFRNLDDSVEIGTRNIKIALRRLRRFARQGVPDELDLDETIRATAHRGYFDLIMRPERRNSVKVLMFLDVGGSMDWHVKSAEELFSAAKSEFKYLEFFYFHNCPYEYVWKDNRRRRSDKFSTMDVLRKYGPDFNVIFVADASMSPYELTMAGGSVEHVNAEPGAIWLQQIAQTYDKLVWLNPVAEKYWELNPSIQLIRRMTSGRMYPLTLAGLDNAMRELMR